MKRLLFLLLILMTVSAYAAVPPDTVYFRAMRDEMARTKKELRVPGAPRPLFAAYKLTESYLWKFGASFGVPVKVGTDLPSRKLSAQVYMYSGSVEHNTSGFDNDKYYFYPAQTGLLAPHYDSIRDGLWRTTNRFFMRDIGTYEKKTAYKRQKNKLQSREAEFTFAKKSEYLEDIPPFTPAEASKYQSVVDELSALGKNIPYAQEFWATLTIGQQNYYFLDSADDFYQYARPFLQLRLWSELRTKAGYPLSLSQNLNLRQEQLEDSAWLKEKTEAFVSVLRQVYEADKPRPYIGPVLLRAQASAGFLNSLFVRSVVNSKALLSAEWDTDRSAGKFKDRLDMRVISPLFDVYDKPGLKEFKGEFLDGFMPVDDEGVTAENLQLVSKGKLTALPSVRSPLPGQTKSNGRARMSARTLPRAKLTNVFFEPRETLSPEELEKQFLERCRAEEQEYCYIFPFWSAAESFVIPFAERIYTADGHKEPVYGLKLEGVSQRSLRDIVAAGDDMTPVSVKADEVPMSVIAPSMIISEMEIVPIEKQPERQPPVPLP